MNFFLETSDTYSRFKGWTKSTFGFYKPHWAAYYQMEVSACIKLSGKRSKKQTLRILEIGFGNGAFMSWARHQGHNIYGLEIEKLQLSAARDAGFMVASSLDELFSEHGFTVFDGIVAFDVFEHLSYKELDKLLRSLNGVLRSDGWLLARFPNGDSPFARLNQHGDITHTITLGSVAMNQLASNTGFKLLSIQSQSNPLRHCGFFLNALYLFILIMRILLELPTQLLLNFYYPGEMRWFALAPNLVARLLKVANSSSET